MKNGLQRWRQSVGRGNQEETSPCSSRPEATQLRPSRLSLTPARRHLPIAVSLPGAEDLGCSVLFIGAVATFPGVSLVSKE